MTAAHHRSHTLFFFDDPATTEIYTLSLHDALPIWSRRAHRLRPPDHTEAGYVRRSADQDKVSLGGLPANTEDRKSTRLNSSHVKISYAVFCLKKKKARLATLVPAQRMLD